MQGTKTLGRIGDFWRRFSTSEDSLARVFRNSAWLVSAKGFGAIAGFFYLAAVTRLLGPAGFGQFIVIVSTVQIITAFARLQTWQTVVHFGAPVFARGDRAGFTRVALGDLAVEAGGALLAFLLLWLLSAPIVAWLDWDPAMRREFLVYGGIVLLAIRSTTTGVLRAADRFRDAAIGDAAIPMARLAGALALIPFGADILGFLIVWALSEVIAALVQAVLVWRARLLGRPGAKVVQPGYWPFLLATNASYQITVLRERGAVLVVGLFAGDAPAGLFRLADQLANSVNRLADIFSRPLFTEMSRLFALGEHARSRALFVRSLRISAFGGALMLALLVVLGRPLIWAMSGEAFLAAYPLLLILGAATILGLASVGLEPLLQAAGRAGLALVARLAGVAAIGLCLWLWLDPRDVTEAAWAMLAGSVATLAVLLAISAWLMRRERAR